MEVLELQHLLFLERQVAVAAIRRTTLGVNKVVYAVMPATLQHMAEPHQVALDVGRGVLKRITDTRLSSQIHHHLRPFFGKEGHQCLALLQSKALKAPCFGGAIASIWWSRACFNAGS